MPLLEPKWSYPQKDPWQEEIVQLAKKVVEAWGTPEFTTMLKNFMLFCGRQVGKSEIVSFAIALLLLNCPGIKLLICSGVERQASTLYQNVLHYIQDSHPFSLKTGKNRPLATKMQLKNGAVLITEPLGIDGASARRHTVHGIILEEMQLIPEAAFAALTPMMLTTGGFLWMLGTAWATEGYVYDRLSDPDFLVIRVNAEEVAKQRPEPNKSTMLNFLAQERKRLSEADYAQEYLAIPQDNARQIFPDTLIAKCQTEKRPGGINKGAEHICGVDPAGLGDDEGCISILKMSAFDKMIQVDSITTKKLLTTQTTQKLVYLHKQYDFCKIYVDDGGVGFGVFSELLGEDSTKFVTEALNNSARSLDTSDEKRKKIMKEDMVFNLLTMMERGDLRLLDDPEIRESLKSYRFEYDKNTKQLKISSNYNHPVEALMRAAWYWQTKGLNLRVHRIKV